MNLTYKEIKMLTLNRKEGESIIIYKDDVEIKITLSETHTGYAKIGIDAPKEYFIDREELLIDE